ncbi:MAG TPA: CHAT domain-containing tetratricopeptide repeat protein [Candidatus Acidoferrum sp.]|nr:CHAT domain-containing tetratricopeptide repeat protein [Candidatus Acidoferrum sp.]
MRHRHAKRRLLHPGLVLSCTVVWFLGLNLQVEGRQQASNAPVHAPAQPNPYHLSPELDGLLRQSWQSLTKHDSEAAKNSVRSALALAREQKNAWGEGEGHRILGLLALEAADYPGAQKEFDQALNCFESEHSSQRVALVHQHNGVVAYYLGKPMEAIALYRQALSEFEAVHDLNDQASVLQNLALIDALPTGEREEYLERGLALATELGNKVLVGRFLHALGDQLFGRGDYAGAIEKLNKAAGAFEETGDRGDLALVWTSFGRLYRAHGAYEEAVSAYRKGLLIQTEIGDKLGVIQSWNAMAISYGEGGQEAQARDSYEHALILARETGSPRVTSFMTGNVGCTYSGKAETAKRAIELLQESVKLDPDSPWTANRYICLGGAYRSAGQEDLALEASDKAVELSRHNSNLDYRSQALRERAFVLGDLGKYREALGDIREALGLLEEIRAKLVAADFLKQGYGVTTQGYFDLAVSLHEKLGEKKEAMVVAEEARARAFLDLLATRSAGQGNAQKTDPGSAKENAEAVPTGQAEKQPKEFASSVALTTRGSSALPLATANGSPVISSGVSVSPPGFDEVVSVAQRLNSTLLSFWVNSDETYVWLVKPDGTLRSEHVAVSSEYLTRLIRATSHDQEESSPQTVASPGPAKSHVANAQRSATRGLHVVGLRGGGELTVGSKPSRGWRELYKLLILPVQDLLPARGGHLTIVPHGPLFRLSFAALQDPDGRYLVESYAINYAPSLGVLRMTGARKQQLGQREPRYLIVADPRIAPSLAKDAELPPLPGARQEAKNLFRLLPRGQASLLVGADASKQAVVEQAAGKTVLHLATHAIVRDDQPWESFLALSSAGNSPRGEGRLSVQEIYGLDLQTDLVVLSACRTALGKVSGDGIAGLTRAFFYGGAPSVMATLWDVADEPTSFLISDFYRSLQKDPDKSRALRDAQLRLIHRLREGRLKVKTSLGPVTLPEDPVFWAGFTLQGEP